MTNRKNKIKFGIKWIDWNGNQNKTVYYLDKPKGISFSKYLWIATGRRNDFKTQCFLNRLTNKQDFFFRHNRIN